MKHPLASCLFLVVAMASIHAEPLGEIDLTPPPGWKSVQPFSPLLADSPLVTLKFVPDDERRAAFIVTLLPADRDYLDFAVTDLDSLSKLTVMAAQPFLDSESPRPVPSALPVVEGLAASLTIPCAPAAATSAAESHRMATTACLLLDAKHVVHVLIYHNGVEAPEYLQAIKAMRSMRVREGGSTRPSGDMAPLATMANATRR